MRRFRAATALCVSERLTYSRSACGDLCIDADMPSHSVAPASPSSVRPPCLHASSVTCRPSPAFLRYAALILQLTVMLNSMPIGDLDIPPFRINLDQIKAWYAEMDAHGGDHTMVLLHADTGIVAVSEATWVSDYPDRAFQNLTAVSPAWRGRGLAKAVKARLLRAVCERRPSVRLVIMSNANVNVAMLAINTQLGFVQHRDVRIFQIARDAIEAALVRSAIVGIRP